MKLTRTTWLFLVAILALVAASASLYVVYSGKASQQENLRDDLDQANTRYGQLTSQKEALTSELAQRESELLAAQSALSEAKQKFPELEETTINYDEILFGMAEHCQLEIKSLVASAPNQVKVAGDIAYIMTYFNVVVEPATPLPATDDESVARILDFVRTIATGEGFESESVGNNIPISVFVNSTTIESVDMSNTQASITMTIYSYLG